MDNSPGWDVLDTSKFTGNTVVTREGTPGRHEPPLCRHEPPRVAWKTKPPLCRNEHAQHIKMCLCNTEGFFKLVF